MNVMTGSFAVKFNATDHHHTVGRLMRENPHLTHAYEFVPMFLDFTLGDKGHAAAKKQPYYHVLASAVMASIQNAMVSKINQKAAKLKMTSKVVETQVAEAVQKAQAPMPKAPALPIKVKSKQEQYDEAVEQGKMLATLLELKKNNPGLFTDLMPNGLSMLDCTVAYLKEELPALRTALGQKILAINGLLTQLGKVSDTSQTLGQLIGK